MPYLDGKDEVVKTYYLRVQYIMSSYILGDNLTARFVCNQLKLVLTMGVGPPSLPPSPFYFIVLNVKGVTN